MQIPVMGMELQAQGIDPDFRLILEEPLGGGAFGDVFKARGVSSGTIFAVKFPKLAFSGSDEIIAFQNEVSAAQKLRHQNIVNILYTEMNISNIPPYLVMEYIEGGTLKSHLDNYRDSDKDTPVEILQSWSKDLIEGITAINSKMLHRDLKPDNLLIDKGILKICDFGLSKVIGAATRTNTFKGGQHAFYMAPEGWNFETNTIQLDMYAVGIILFEMASLIYPYDIPSAPSGIDFDAIRKMHLYQSPKPLIDLRPELPVEFYHLVSRLMEKRANDRFSSWENVKEALEKMWITQGNTTTKKLDKVATLLKQTSRLHQIKTSRELELEKLAEERQEKRRLNEYQYDKLVNVLREIVKEFNFRSTLGEISEHPGLVFVLPISNSSKPKSIQLVFYPVEPQLNLRIGQVNYAATLIDAGHPRLNFLLCRDDENDLYGRWIVCESMLSGLVSPDLGRPYPFDKFGFYDHDIHEIESSDQAMHVYEITFGEDVEGAFLKAISESMERK